MPPLGRLVGLAMICAGLGTVSVATPETAVAHVAAPSVAQPSVAQASVAQRSAADRPTAIAVARGGLTYVGFSSGTKIQVLAPGSGKPKGSFNLASSSPVAGLFVTSGDDIWVDQASGVSLVTPKGRVLRAFDHQPAGDCDDDTPASRYGGIVSEGKRVYVANRCHPSVSVYTRTGSHRVTLDLPGNGIPRGIAWGPAQANKPATLYVAQPDRGVVLAYRAGSLSARSTPMAVYAVDRPGGGRAPQPAGVAVDKWGQLAITDVANHAVYMVDVNNDFSLYRTLGHPPRASRQAGRLNTPSAIAQHDQDGSGLAGDLFIADTNNTRVQRWNNSGYTFWAKQVKAGAGGRGPDDPDDPDPGGPDDPDDPGDPDGPGGPGGSGPVNSTPPAISGTPAVGEVLTCSQGTWSATSGGSISYTVRWQRDGSPITGATTPTYTVAAEDAGASLSCVVQASNSGGSRTASSSPLPVPGAGSERPVNQTPPAITGTPAVGQPLTCSPGTWTPAGLTFAYAWRREGTALPGATTATYTPVAADNGARLTCAVSATTASGTTTSTSAPVTVGSGGTGPVNTAPPTITGTQLPGQALTCTTGTWTGTGITYTYVWRRGTTPVGTSQTYTVLNEDVGTTFTCAVTATFAAGSTTATSAAVTVGGPSGHAPLNSTPPSITPGGTVNAGQVLTCSPGVWTGAPTFTYLWRRGTAVIAGAATATYTTSAMLDAGQPISCTVVGTNATGDGAASSAAVTVTDGKPPSNTGAGTAPPTLSGSGDVGTALTCDPGTWTGFGITYGYAWSRDGVPIPDTGTARYVVLSEDLGTSLTCTITARNAAGARSATTPGLPLDALVPGAPVPTAPPAITGTAAVGQTLTCSTGTWDGAPTSFTTIWQRDGETVGTGATRTVVAADQTGTLRCVVIASNAAGKGAARSEGIGGAACTGPVGVTINAGAADTTNPHVQLSIRVPAGTTSITISNNADLSGAATRAVSGTCTYPWKLDSIPGLPLTWPVYVQFNGAGTLYSDTIVVSEPATLGLGW